MHAVQNYICQNAALVSTFSTFAIQIHLTDFTNLGSLIPTRHRSLELNTGVILRHYRLYSSLNACPGWLLTTTEIIVFLNKQWPAGSAEL